MRQNLNHRVYVDMDSILDTRLALVNKMNPNLATMLIKSKRYFSRTSDNFSNIIKAIDQKKYNELWDKRKWDDIKKAVYQTGVVEHLTDLSGAIIEDSVRQPFRQGTAITLNTWPYSIDAEGKDYLKKFLELATAAEVNIVHIPIDFQTPEYFKSNYEYLFMYDFHKWLEIHIEGLKEKPMGEVTLSVPLLVARNKSPGKKYNIDQDREFMENEFRSHVQLQHVPICQFSMSVKDKVKS